MTTPFIRVEHASMRYGNRVALDDCSLHVSRHETLGVAGPNGAGKTTLARLILGLLGPTGGLVEVGGESPSRFRATRGVGYAPEEAPPPWTCRVAELLAMRTADAQGAVVSPVVESLAIGHLLSKRLRELSKGQWRLALVAYALVAAPGLVVLDEPDSGLDPMALDRLTAATRAAVAAGSTVIVLSHNLDELERLCDRIVVVSNGTIRASYDRATFTRAGMRELYREAIA